MKELMEERGMHTEARENYFGKKFFFPHHIMVITLTGTWTIFVSYLTLLPASQKKKKLNPSLPSM